MNRDRLKNLAHQLELEGYLGPKVQYSQLGVNSDELAHDRRFKIVDNTYPPFKTLIGHDIRPDHTHVVTLGAEGMNEILTPVVLSGLGRQSDVKIGLIFMGQQEPRKPSKVGVYGFKWTEADFFISPPQEPLEPDLIEKLDLTDVFIQSFRSQWTRQNMPHWIRFFRQNADKLPDSIRNELIYRLGPFVPKKTSPERQGRNPQTGHTYTRWDD